MDEHRKAVGRRVLEWREARGWSQEDLAYKAGLSVKTARRIERGTHEGRRDTMKKLAKAFEVDIAELIGEPPAPLGLGRSAEVVDTDRLAALEQGIAAMREQLEHQAADLARQFRMLSKIFRKLAATPEFWALVAEAEAEAEALAQSAEAAPGAPSGTGGAEGGQQRTG